MLSGARVAPECGTTAGYFAAIDECVPYYIASSSSFLDSFLLQKSCSPGNVTTLTALEALRFCTHIDDGLGIHVDDDGADFTALFDVTEIKGSL